MEFINDWDVLKHLDKDFVEKIKFICVFGDGKDVLIVMNNDCVYGFGSNSWGGLGLGHNKEVKDIFLINDLCHKQMIDICYGSQHFISLTKTGQCIGWGRNDCAQLGFHSNDLINKPKIIDCFSDLMIKSVSCGSKHTLVLTISGEVFAFGLNDRNQCINEENKGYCLPLKVDLKEKVVSISTGSNHSLALTEKGCVNAWGDNSCGQIDMNIKQYHSVPKKIEFNNEVAKCFRKQIVAEHKKENYLLLHHVQENGCSIALIETIERVSHKLLLRERKTKNNLMKAKFDEMINHNCYTNELVEITSLTKTLGEEIVSLPWGENHSLVITKKGCVYGCGDDKCERINNWTIGSFHSIHQKVVETEKTPEKLLKKIICGKNHSLLLTTEGELYSIGCISDVCEKRNDIKRCDHSILQQLSIGNTFTDIASHSSLQISVALSQNGFCFVWGEVFNKQMISPKETPFKSIFKTFAEYSKLKITYKPKFVSNSDNSLICLNVNKMSKTIIDLFNNQNDSDFKFTFGTQECIFVHKFVLKNRCKHFRTLFSDNGIISWDILGKNETDYAFIKYLYTDSIDVKPEDVFQLYYLADNYFDEELKQKCLPLIKNGVSIENVCDFYSLSNRYELTDIETYCLEFSSHKWNQIFKTKTFKFMDKTLLTKFIESAAKLNLFS